MAVAKTNATKPNQKKTNKKIWKTHNELATTKMVRLKKTVTYGDDDDAAAALIVVDSFALRPCFLLLSHSYLFHLIWFHSFLPSLSTCSTYKKGKEL